MNKNIAQFTKTMLALVAPALLCCAAPTASAASIGTPTYTTYGNSNPPPQTNNLTQLGLFGDLDWQIYGGMGGSPTTGINNPIKITYNRAGGGSITNLGMYFSSAAVISESTQTRSYASFAWSDGTPPNTSNTGFNPLETWNSFKTTASTVAYDAYYETFQFVPGDTNPHTIYLYGYYTLGSLAQFQFETSLAGVATPPTLNPAFSAGNFIYSVTFQADHPTDALTVKFTFQKTGTAGTLCAFGIEAAAIANYSPNFLVWQGGASANWDTTTANWTGAATKYSDAYGAQFDDTASQFSVNVSSTVNPQDVYVTNSANDYTISGSPIAGSGSLLKTGSRTLTLSGANTFSGGVQVNGGYLTLGASEVLPSGAGAGDVAINSGATLNLNGFSQTVNGLNGGGIVDIPTVSGGTSTLTVGNNNASGSFSGNINDTFGTVSLIKTGTGSLTLSGTNNTFSGGVQLNAGQLNINSASAIGSGPFTIAGGTTLDNTSGGNLTLSTGNAQNWNGDFTVLGSSSLNMGAGAVTMNANRTIAVSNSTFAVGGVISGSGYGLTKNGAGQLNLRKCQ